MTLQDTQQHHFGHDYLQIFETIWTSVVPKKCTFSLWTVFHRKINTLEVIKKKCPSMYLNPNRCILCYASSEDVDYLLLDCKITKSLWNKMSEIMGDSVNINNFTSLSRSVSKLKQTSRKKVIRFNVVAGLFWTVWIERKNRIFKEKSNSIVNLWKDICNLIEVWSRRHTSCKQYDLTTISLNFRVLLD